MKTNDIKLYILTCINIENSKRICALNYEGLLNCLNAEFREYAKEKLTLGYSEKTCFIDYCGGLPSIFKAAFETHKQKELLKQWGVGVSKVKNEYIYVLFYEVVYSVFKEWRANRWK